MTLDTTVGSCHHEFLQSTAKLLKEGATIEKFCKENGLTMSKYDFYLELGKFTWNTELPEEPRDVILMNKVLPIVNTVGIFCIVVRLIDNR